MVLKNVKVPIKSVTYIAVKRNYTPINPQQKYSDSMAKLNGVIKFLNALPFVLTMKKAGGSMLWILNIFLESLISLY